MDDNTIKFHVQDEEQQQMNRKFSNPSMQRCSKKATIPLTRLSAIFFLKTRRISPITITPAA